MIPCSGSDVPSWRTTEKEKVGAIKMTCYKQPGSERFPWRNVFWNCSSVKPQRWDRRTGRGARELELLLTPHPNSHGKHSLKPKTLGKSQTPVGFLCLATMLSSKRGCRRICAPRHGFCELLQGVITVRRHHAMEAFFCQVLSQEDSAGPRPSQQSRRSSFAPACGSRLFRS